MEEGADPKDPDTKLSRPGSLLDANHGKGRKVAKCTVLGKDSTTAPDGRNNITRKDEPVFKSSGKMKKGEPSHGHVKSFHANHYLVRSLVVHFTVHDK